jgi:hypothetical protein
LIGEIAVKSALAHCMSVLVETSLRDTQWWVPEAVRMRDHPHGEGFSCSRKVALVYVSPPSNYEAVWQRVVARGRREGRWVNQHDFNLTWTAAPRTVKALKRHLDLYVDLQSSGRDPTVIEVWGDVDVLPPKP